MTEEIQIHLQTLTSDAGVYQFYDSDNQLLYVGKAKNLKKRVSSYFQKEHDSGKTRVLVKKIQRLETIVVESEYEALLLENNLIKKYKPRYNILLKDDKTYPWICIKNESFPRVFRTRKLIKDGSEYFGPYASVKLADTLLGLIREIYPLRNCNLDLRPEKIAKGNYKICLEFHLGNCLGPCESKQSSEDYNQNIQSIREIIKGNFGAAVKYMTEKMKEAAQNLEFELAQSIKEKLQLLENYQARSTVVHPSINNVDVFSIVSDESYAYVNFLKINNGAIVQSYTLEAKKKMDESESDILTQAIIEVRERFNSTSKEIYLPFELEVDFENLKLTVPKIGDKKRIVELSERNAKHYRLEQLKHTKIVDPDRHTKRIMAQMKADLRMPQEPLHIEGFDNSNIQGTSPVASCVVFKKGKPSKKDYRIFNIKTVEGPNDFASMEEVIYRRYKRLLDEDQPLPQLIVIDGGKGQLSSAVSSLEKLELRGKISILGIAKRLEELYFPDDPIPLYLDKASETLKVIQHIRNESHRFALSHHRNRRSKSSLSSELELISGLGSKSISALLAHFKSIKRIKSADEEELSQVVGSHRAKKILEFYKTRK